MWLITIYIQRRASDNWIMGNSWFATFEKNLKSWFTQKPWFSPTLIAWRHFWVLLKNSFREPSITCLDLGISLTGFLGNFRRSCNVGWHASPWCRGMPAYVAGASEPMNSATPMEIPVYAADAVVERLAIHRGFAVHWSELTKGTCKQNAKAYICPQHHSTSNESNSAW